MKSIIITLLVLTIFLTGCIQVVDPTGQVTTTLPKEDLEVRYCFYDQSTDNIMSGGDVYLDEQYLGRTTNGCYTWKRDTCMQKHADKIIYKYRDYELRWDFDCGNLRLHANLREQKIIYDFYELWKSSSRDISSWNQAMNAINSAQDYENYLNQVNRHFTALKIHHSNTQMLWNYMIKNEAVLGSKTSDYYQIKKSVNSGMISQRESIEHIKSQLENIQQAQELQRQQEQQALELIGGLGQLLLGAFI